MKHVIVFFIRVYQKTLSPDHGWFSSLHPNGYCRFHPTCSEYARQAVEKFGAGRGTWLALKRVVRCHPWSKGGIDSIPDYNH